MADTMRAPQSDGALATWLRALVFQIVSPSPSAALSVAFMGLIAWQLAWFAALVRAFRSWSAGWMGVAAPLLLALFWPGSLATAFAWDGEWLSTVGIALALAMTGWGGPTRSLSLAVLFGAALGASALASFAAMPTVVLTYGALAVILLVRRENKRALVCWAGAAGTTALLVWAPMLGSPTHFPPKMLTSFSAAVDGAWPTTPWVGLPAWAAGLALTLVWVAALIVCPARPEERHFGGIGPRGESWLPVSLAIGLAALPWSATLGGAVAVTAATWILLGVWGRMAGGIQARVLGVSAAAVMGWSIVWAVARTF
jgi:hypothetical protein